MTAEDQAQARFFLAICEGHRPPDAHPYEAGWDAHVAGEAFHAGPRPLDGVEGLSWRLGWNDRALFVATGGRPLAMRPAPSTKAA